MIPPPDLAGVRAPAAVAAVTAVRPLVDASDDGQARRMQFAAAEPLRAQLSETGRLIDRVLQFVQANPMPASLSNTPLLPAPAAGIPVQAHDLAFAIRDSLANSGLFYESHLAQWVNGARPLQSLLTQPQAVFAQLASDEESRHAAHDAAPDKPDNRLLNVEPQDLARAAWLVSLQLDALEHRRAAWQGELWPGQPLGWEIRDEQSHEASGNDTATTGRGWQSTIALTLPGLGAITASLYLHASQQLRIVLQPAGHDTAALLKSAGPSLASALEAAGVTLELLTVQREAQAQEAGAGSGKESATECINDISDDARRAAIRDVS